MSKGRILKPTASEKLFNRFLSTIDWGFENRIKWQCPMQVYDRILYPDFRFLPSRLIIEIDGSIHWNYAADRDCRRDFWFEECGYKTLHIANAEVEGMTHKRLAEAIQGIYPTFPVPTDEMNRLHKMFRERFIGVQGRAADSMA